MKLLFFILSSVVASGIGQLFLNAGAKAGNPMGSQVFGKIPAWFPLIFNVKIVVGLSFWLLATLLWLGILRLTELSYAYCLGSLNYLFIPLASRWLFKEPLGKLRIIGMIIIFIGVLLTLYGKYVEHTRL